MINVFPQTITLSDIPLKPKDRKEIEGILHLTARKIKVERRQFSGEIEIVGGIQDRTIKAYITTNARDRMREIVEPGGADLSVYLKQPRLLWNHDYSIPAIGRAQWLKTNEKGIISCFEYAPTQFAEEIYQLYRLKFINTFSIGFMVLPGGYDDETMTFKKWHLLEVSAVNIPANPEAEVVTDDELARTGAVIQTKSLRDVIHLVDRKEGQKLEEPGNEDFTADGKKPYPNEHACVLTSKDKYEKFRKGTRDHEGKEYTVLYGKIKGESTWEDHSFRYPKDTWTVKEAGTHCKSHDGSFEAAADEDSICPECGNGIDGTEEKILDLQGNPSTWDIQQAVQMAVYEAYPGPENIGAEAPYFYATVSELYPIDYPDGKAIIYVIDKEKANHFFLHSYKYADDKATLGANPVEVTVGYRKRSADKNIEPGKMILKLDTSALEPTLRLMRETVEEFARVRDDMVKQAEKLGLKITAVGVADPETGKDSVVLQIAPPPPKDIISIELADVDAMHKDGAGEPRTIELDREAVRQAFHEALGSEGFKIDARELILLELDKRLGRMK